MWWNKCASTPWMRCNLHWLPFALTPARNTITLFVSKECSEHLFSWLVKSKCLMIGQNLMPSDCSSQSASRLVKQECLLIDQAKVPPDCSKYRVPLACLNCNVSWLVKPSWLLIGRTVIYPDLLNFNASRFVKPECLLIAQTLMPPDCSSQVASWLVEL